MQAAFIAEQAAQCGYCTNGMVMTTVALLSEVAKPDARAGRAALAGNLCRCGSHDRVLRAVHRRGRNGSAHGYHDRASGVDRRALLESAPWWSGFSAPAPSDRSVRSGAAHLGRMRTAGRRFLAVRATAR